MEPVIIIFIDYKTIFDYILLGKDNYNLILTYVLKLWFF